jgi:hypothetical protein
MLSINHKFDQSISIEELKNKSGNINISTEGSRKNNIRKRLNLLKLDIFKMSIKYIKINKMELRAKYNLLALGAQKCVITLDPVLFNIKEEFDIRFISIDKLDLSTLDDVYTEPIYNNYINFSEIGIQMFSSFLTSYPKINDGDIDLDSIYKNDKKLENNNNNPFEALNNINK